MEALTFESCGPLLSLGDFGFYHVSFYHTGLRGIALCSPLYACCPGRALLRRELRRAGINT